MNTNYLNALSFETATIKERETVYKLAAKFALAEIEAMKVHEFLQPKAVVTHLQNAYMSLEHEIFGVLLLNNQNQLIDSIELFRGTVDGAAVYPREVVKLALKNNASACIFFHNHPSGIAQPSDADRAITDRLKNALSVIDIRVLDHFIVSKAETYSFAAHGLV